MLVWPGYGNYDFHLGTNLDIAVKVVIVFNVIRFKSQIFE